MSKVRIQGTDLSGHLFGLHRCLHRSAVTMPKHQQGLYSKYSDAILKAGDDLRSHNVSRHTRYEDVTNRLIEDHLHRHAGIGAREHRGKWLLLIHRVLSQNGEISFDGGQLSRRGALVPVDQLL